MVSKCKATNVTGAPCAAHVRPGDEYCRWHAPERAPEREEWRRRGGKNKSNMARLRKLWSEERLDPAEVTGLLSAALVATYEGKLESSVMTALASGTRALLDAHKTTEVEERLAILEARAGLANGRTA